VGRKGSGNDFDIEPVSWFSVNWRNLVLE